MPSSAYACFEGDAGDIRYNDDESVAEYCNGAMWVAFPKSAASDADPCEDPTGVKGDIFYNDDNLVMQWCDGNVWHPMGPIGGITGAGCTSPAGNAGDMIYNDDESVLQYCEGNGWVAVVDAFVPSDVANLEVWLDGADSNSIIVESGEVTKWTDKSGGTDYSFLKRSGNTAPSYDLNNSRLLFNNTHLYFPGNVTNLTGQEATYFVVAEHNLAAPSGFDHMYGAFRFNGNEAFGSGLYVVNTNARFISRDGGSGTGPLLTHNASPYNNLKLFAGRAEPQNNIFKINRILVDSDPLSNVDAHGYWSSIGAGIGASGLGSFYDGYIYEILHYSDPLTDAQISQVENYLSLKWGI